MKVFRKIERTLADGKKALCVFVLSSFTWHVRGSSAIDEVEACDIIECACCDDHDHDHDHETTT